MIPGLIYSLVAALEMRRDMWPDKRITLLSEGMYQKVIQSSGTFGGPSRRSVCPCRRRAAAIRIPTERTPVGEGHRSTTGETIRTRVPLGAYGLGETGRCSKIIVQIQRGIVVGLAHVCSWSLGK